ncbi:hypothetical protein RRG08_021274 [Elysia crispata]|uniref:Uncharacterized protein n=1 Tax=Elysia crispata TaxID=231223 RepID=A0AAE0ZAH0_9GAST|nr:hypothetical protein RRG08_021274 [Elysia crispata]
MPRSILVAFRGFRYPGRHALTRRLASSYTRWCLGPQTQPDQKTNSTLVMTPGIFYLVSRRKCRGRMDSGQIFPRSEGSVQTLTGWSGHSPPDRLTCMERSFQSTPVHSIPLKSEWV